MEKRIQERLDEEDIEFGDANHQWERHEITKYREWAHREGFRAKGDKSPWRPDFYDLDRLDALDEGGKAQLVQVLATCSHDPLLQAIAAGSNMDSVGDASRK